MDSLLGTLTQSENATELADNWARLATHFDTLFTTEQSIDKLKQTILQLAVMGRLVEQSTKDSSASKILEEISDEKNRQIRQGLVKKPKGFHDISGDEFPFVAPNGWQWTHLENLAALITKGSSPKWQGVSYTDDDSDVLFITSENVSTYELSLETKKFVEQRFNEIEPRSRLIKGDFLMNIVGASIGRTAIYDLDDDANINQAVCLIRLVESGMNKRFLLHFFNSQLCRSYMFDKQVDNARANLSMGNISKFLIPIPPGDEQKRIVEKLDELILLAEQLKERLHQASETRCQLAGAVVEKALN